MSDLQDFFEEVLFRSMGSVRFTQNSPIMTDVWQLYGRAPGQAHDLLLIPHDQSSPGELAASLIKRLAEYRRRLRAAPRDAHYNRIQKSSPRVAYNETSVVARLHLEELIRVGLPMSRWWRKNLVEGNPRVAQFVRQPERSRTLLANAFAADPDQEPGADDTGAPSQNTIWQAGRFDVSPEEFSATESLIWLARIVGLLVAIDDQVTDSPELIKAQQYADSKSALDQLKAVARDAERLTDCVIRMLDPRRLVQEDGTNYLWSVNNNRRSEASLYRSIRSVKADAAQSLFDVRGAAIRWAVIDSGIDATHIAFRRRHADGRPLGPGGEPITFTRGAHDAGTDEDLRRSAFVSIENPRTGKVKPVNQTRIVRTLDFTVMRDYLGAARLSDLPEQLVARASSLGLKADLRKALKFGSVIDWELLEPLLEVPHDEQYAPPEHHHGTHVAGIIGADWRENEHRLSPSEPRTGLAPEIQIYDLRALGPDGTGDEFSILAAMQYVRSLNSRLNQMEIHGVNLSFSIRHEVASFACGRTPVCNEADRLVGAGVVVVAAAGNRGRARYISTQGSFDEGYRHVSITDPGNAEAVITVGATHRQRPHNYGVSYFSSRGPTGDGRAKPDLVAPGEKIYSTIPGNREKELDGTSMAAPHVSGAVALLLERNFELVGQPRRVKQILCDAATDLGREKSFQGAGMIDILRSLQSV